MRFNQCIQFPQVDRFPGCKSLQPCVCIKSASENIHRLASHCNRSLNVGMDQESAVYAQPEAFFVYLWRKFLNDQSNDNAQCIHPGAVHDLRTNSVRAASALPYASGTALVLPNKNNVNNSRRSTQSPANVLVRPTIPGDISALSVSHLAVLFAFAKLREFARHFKKHCKGHHDFARPSSYLAHKAERPEYSGKFAKSMCGSHQENVRRSTASWVVNDNPHNHPFPGIGALRLNEHSG